MSYEIALAAAGCKVIAFEEFGSYQGTWLAFVEYNGEKGIVEGSYGSCSGCDSYMGEFSFDDGEPTERDGIYYKNENTWEEDCTCTKEEFEEAKRVYDKRLSDFGSDYLAGGLYGKEHYANKIKNLKEEDWFNDEEREVCEWALNQNF